MRWVVSNFRVYCCCALVASRKGVGAGKDEGNERARWGASWTGAPGNAEPGNARAGGCGTVEPGNALKVLASRIRLIYNENDFAIGRAIHGELP